MRLLFDQNISFRIIRKISDTFPKAKQVREIVLKTLRIIQSGSTQKYDYCLVTFDSDFIDLLMARGFPPKIIWLKSGNSSTKYLADRLQNEGNNTMDFLKDEKIAVLELV